jgi:hypothetical protein
MLPKDKKEVRSCRKRETREILRDIFVMMSYEKIRIRLVEEKENIFENSEFTCFCKILRSGNFLQVRLINKYKMRKNSILIFYNIKVLRIVYKIQNFHSFETTHKSATSVFGCLAKMSNVDFKVKKQS